MDLLNTITIDNDFLFTVLGATEIITQAYCGFIV
jgi:hypothetical protein